jgi:di/tricarboxylate transporter
MIGKTIREGHFRSTYNAAVIAVGRNGERLKMKIGDIMLRPGDTLLLEAHESFAAQQRNSRDFYLVSELEGSTPLLHDKAWLALGILAVLVLSVTMGWASMLQASLTAAVLMVVARCCKLDEARRAIDLEVLLMIAGSFAIAKAMDKTGAASAIAHSLIGLVSDSPWLTLAAVYVITMAFTELMSNNAAAVLVFPIAWAAADRLNVDPMPFVVAVTVAASCGFATPLGYQTNIMVYGPGGYRFVDYLRFGGLLNLLVAAVTVTLAPRIWPFG